MIAATFIMALGSRGLQIFSRSRTLVLGHHVLDLRGRGAVRRGHPRRAGRWRQFITLLRRNPVPSSASMPPTKSSISAVVGGALTPAAGAGRAGFGNFVHHYAFRVRLRHPADAGLSNSGGEADRGATSCKGARFSPPPVFCSPTLTRLPRARDALSSRDEGWRSDQAGGRPYRPRHRARRGWLSCGSGGGIPQGHRNRRAAAPAHANLGNAIAALGAMPKRSNAMNGRSPSRPILPPCTRAWGTCCDHRANG